MERSKRALRRWVVFCLLLSGCGAAAVQTPQEAPPPAQVEPQVAQTETQEVPDVPAPAPAQDQAEEPAPPAEPRKPLEAPVLETRELPAFAGDDYLQWEIKEEPWIYSEHPVAHTSTHLMALADGRLQPAEFPAEQVLANSGLPAETLSQLELVRISPDAETLVYKQPIAFSEPDWVGVCVPYSFRYYVVSGGRMQTFDLELDPREWEWAMNIDEELRNAPHAAAPKMNTYISDIDEETMDSLLNVQDPETGDSLEIMAPWRWQLTGILPKTAVEAYLQL